jgi:hypothetical protein
MGEDEESSGKEGDESKREATNVPNVVKFKGHEAQLSKNPDDDDGETEQLVGISEQSKDNHEESQ